MALLRYIDESHQLVTRTLDTEGFVIGRAPTCQIVFDGELISREHVRIDMESDGRFRIRDLGSRNKTYVNGELIAETLLIGGDVIRVGEHVLEFLDDSGTEKLDPDFVSTDQTDPPDCDWAKVRHPISMTNAQMEQLALLWSDQALMARPEDIAEAALGQIVLDVQADRAIIALRGEKKTDMRPLAQRAMRRPVDGSAKSVSQSFLMAPVLQQVAGRYPQSASKINPKLGFAATAVVAPLTFRGEVVGVLYVDRPTAKKPFQASALQYCMAAGAQLGAMLGEASRRLVRSAAREGVAWMTMLRRVQASLSYPAASNDSFDTALKCYPGRARCGDFGDVLHLDEQRACCLVVDGGGQGINGIVQSTTIRAGIRAALAVAEESLMDPAPVFNELNHMVASSRARQVIPCAYVGIDMASGKLVYINAGCMAPLLMIAPGRLITLDQPSLVLGIDRDYLYEGTRVDLPDSFRLVCHTNGLVEATNSAGETLGDNRLHDTFLDRAAWGTAMDVLSRIGLTWSNHLAGAQPDDDALVLVLGFG